MLFGEYAINELFKNVVIVPLIVIITPVHVLHLFSISALRNVRACIDNTVSHR